MRLISIRCVTIGHLLNVLIVLSLLLMYSSSMRLISIRWVTIGHLLNVLIVLSFLLMYSSSGLSTDFFPNKTNINTVAIGLRHTVKQLLIHLHSSLVF